ncbi:TetR/AcrR family transcriptional regulator C-terminal domain-containing protein [Nonomuraea dietziae]|uniref:TetR/AcrR family tetracycline transcriptional repressor n=2 Tax=Nonomuraea dietziae TaxID=65515 RepID=A0A7W5V3Z3_9ACTN|nr:TetR/AcrR family transcriptional regulator C-terminal domain-containing protein [Nonomuraea dietziae]MBB3725773.1 TetR/AcrR family tetracycline transcriptional repressor [Nonomuraea dietziae]
MGENRRAGLTPQKLIDAALRLLDEVGLEGLTVRRLAAELGVRSPALYWHIRTKQDLLDGMAGAIVLSAGMGPPEEGESWQDWLARRGRSYRRSLLAHRDGARVVANATGLGQEPIRRLNEELTAMLAHGFTPVLALRTITAISHYVTGFVLQEQAARPPGTAPLDPLIDLLGGDVEAPLVVALREGSSAGGDAAFEHGLHAIIAGTMPAGPCSDT